MAIKVSWERDAGVIMIGDSRSGPSAHAAYSYLWFCLGSILDALFPS